MFPRTVEGEYHLSLLVSTVFLIGIISGLVKGSRMTFVSVLKKWTVSDSPIRPFELELIKAGLDIAAESNNPDERDSDVDERGE